MTGSTNGPRAKIPIVLGCIAYCCASCGHLPRMSDDPLVMEHEDKMGKAIENHDLVGLETLLVAGVDPNLYYAGIPILSFALDMSFNDGVKLLLRYGAKTNLRSFDGTYPIHYAAMLDSEEMMTLLLTYGAKVNVKDRLGETPLMLAARGPAGDWSAWFAGDPRPTDPASLQARKAYFEMVKMLVRAGANINARAGPSGTALDIAESGGYQDVVDFLIANGGKRSIKRPAGQPISRWERR